MTRRPAQESAARPPAESRFARWLPSPGPELPAGRPRRGERRAWKAIGLVALACVLGTSAAALGAGLAQRNMTEERTYFQAIDRLDIDSGPAQVTVRAGGTDRVVVSERFAWALRKPTVSQRIDAGTLSISIGCPEARMLFSCTVALDIQVPATTTIKSRNGSGRTEILDISGSTSAETGSGQIELTRVSGAVWAKGGSGQIIGTGLTSPEARLFSSSGQVTLQYDRPPTSVTARLASGNLVLQVPDDGSQYRLDLSSDGGRQEIDPSLQNAASPRLLDIVTASGTVTMGRRGLG